MKRRIRSLTARMLPAALALAGTVTHLGTDDAAAQSVSKTVGLKVLIISGGGTQLIADASGGCTVWPDQNRVLMENLLREMGVAYDVFDASTRQLTPQDLADGTAPDFSDASNGKYNGIIVTDTELAGLQNAASCSSALEGKFSENNYEEWTTLYNYERAFKVRETVMSGFPATYGPFDYGMASVRGASGLSGRWTIPTARRREVFEYVNRSAQLPISEWSLASTPRATPGTGPTVQRLLVDNANPADALVSILQYPDGREVLLSTIAHAPYLIYSQVLAYEFVNWATKGVMAGGRKAYLTAHNDDLFIPNDIWNLQTRAIGPDVYRITDTDFANLVVQQSALRNNWSTARGFVLEFAFNGWGVPSNYGGGPAEDTGTPSPDPLTEAVRTHRSNFGFINHTWRHWDNDTRANELPCLAFQDPDALTPPYAAEITNNRTVWQRLGLPQRAQNNAVMVAGDHSGLKDDACEDAPQPLLGYEQGGRNDAWLGELAGIGVTGVASDSSQPGQEEERYEPSGRILVLPRRANNLFYMVTNPEEWVDSYNWLYYDRFDPPGSGCGGPGICARVSSMQQILDDPTRDNDEVDTALRHILTYRQWSFFFHQANLKQYAPNRSLQFDWLNSVVGAYQKLLNLPLQSPRFFQIRNDTANRVRARGATIDAYATLDAAGNPVSVTVQVPAGGPVTMMMTGVRGATTALYGGQSVQNVTLGSTPTTLTVNRAL